MFSLILRGRRLFELQNCRSLTVPATLLQKASAFAESISYASAADLKSENYGKGNTIPVSYLVDSCGLSTQQAESISMKVNLKDSDNLLRVLNLLRSHEFTNSQICKIIKTYPRLLLSNTEESLRPKLEFLQSKGASTSELCEIVSKVPRILGKRSEKSAGLCYDFLKEILILKNESVKIHPSLAKGAQKNIVRNIMALRQLGVPQKSLSRLLISFPGSVSGKERFEESLKKVVEMGFDPTTSKFTSALQTFYETSDNTIQQKLDIFKRCGFSENDIWAIFKKWPLCFKFSEAKITLIFETLKSYGLLEEEIQAVFKKFPECLRYSEQKIVNSMETLLSIGFSKDEVAMIMKRYPRYIGSSIDTVKEKIEYMVKRMGYPLAAVCSLPAVVGYSMEKRIIPRCNVIRALMSKGIIKEIPSVWTVLAPPTDEFLDTFVEKHRQEFPDLIQIFDGNLHFDHV